MDVLTDLLNMLELKGWLSSRRELVGTWRYDFAASDDSTFHVISNGGALLEVDGYHEVIRVDDGDVILFPTGHPHSLYDNARSPLTQFVQLDYNPKRKHHIVYTDGQDPDLLMLCGAFHFNQPHDYALLQCLPKLIHISGKQGRIEQGFADIIHLLARESASEQPGAEVMLSRLTELLFIQVIRLWLEQENNSSTGWSGALRDPSISNALALIHESPEHRWTVKELADAVALSRSAFSARFSELVGEPPMKYLTRWRMLRATRMLKNDIRVEKVAEQLGYESEVAFRKAFKREIGIPPAQYRKSG